MCVYVTVLCVELEVGAQFLLQPDLHHAVVSTHMKATQCQEDEQEEKKEASTKRKRETRAQERHVGSLHWNGTIK